MIFKSLCTSILYRLRICKNKWPKALLEYGNMQLYKSAHGYEFDLNNPVMYILNLPLSLNPRTR